MDDMEVAAGNPIEASQSKIVGSRKDSSTEAEGHTIVGSASENTDNVGSAKEAEFVGSPQSKSQFEPIKSFGPVSPVPREESE